MKIMRFFLLILTILILPSAASGQEKTDTLKTESGLSAEEIEELTTPMKPAIVGGGDLAPLQPASSLVGDLPVRPDLEPQPMPVHWYSFPILKRGDYLPSWSTGQLFGAHGVYGDYLNGYSSYTQMGLRQTMGEYWTLDASVSLQKSLYYNAASFNTSVNWHPSKYFEFTAFASYMPGSFLSQMQGMPAFHWGGYATFQTDTEVPFGIDLGARDYYDPFSGHHVTPIVQPFIKIGNSKLGFDFGPMIEDAINRSNHRDNGGFNPIPQPIKAIPQIPPHR